MFAQHVLPELHVLPEMHVLPALHVLPDMHVLHVLPALQGSDQFTTSHQVPGMCCLRKQPQPAMRPLMQFFKTMYGLHCPLPNNAATATDVLHDSRPVLHTVLINMLAPAAWQKHICRIWQSGLTLRANHNTENTHTHSPSPLLD